MGFNAENGESPSHSNAATDDATISIAQFFLLSRNITKVLKKQSRYLADVTQGTIPVRPTSVRLYIR